MTRTELKDYAFLSNDDIQRIRFDGQLLKTIYTGEDGELYLAYEKLIGRFKMPLNAKIRFTADTYEELEDLKGEFL